MYMWRNSYIRIKLFRFPFSYAIANQCVLHKSATYWLWHKALLNSPALAAIAIFLFVSWRADVVGSLKDYSAIIS